MINKNKYLIIQLSKMVIDLGSIFGLDLHDRVLSFLVKIGLVARQRRKI